MKTKHKGATVSAPQILQIIPAPPNANGITQTQHTKVLGPGGIAITGIHKITLVAEINNVWRATIECHVTPPQVTAESTLVYPHPIPRWKVAVMRWIGLGTLQTTDLAGSEHSFHALAKRER